MNNIHNIFLKKYNIYSLKYLKKKKKCRSLFFSNYRRTAEKCSLFLIIELNIKIRSHHL